MYVCVLFNKYNNHKQKYYDSARVSLKNLVI